MKRLIKTLRENLKKTNNNLKITLKLKIKMYPDIVENAWFMFNWFLLTHPAAPQTARWPAPRCPACCGGGGSASWSCSTAWTGTAGSGPARRLQPGQRAATGRRTRPAETRRVPRRAWPGRGGEVMGRWKGTAVQSVLGEVRSKSGRDLTCCCCSLLLQLEQGWSCFLMQTHTTTSSSSPLPQAFLFYYAHLSSSSSSLILCTKKQIPFWWKVNIA